MPCTVAKHAGFCMGVRQAVEKAERAAAQAQERGIPCYSLGEVVHNPLVTSRLQQLGVQVVERVEDARGGLLILRSHGVAPQVLSACRENGVDYVDCTCARVRALHERAAAYSAGGLPVVLVGDGEHPEVRGTAGRRQGPVYTVYTAEDVAALPPLPRALVASQTTLPMERWQALLPALRARISQPDSYMLHLRGNARAAAGRTGACHCLRPHDRGRRAAKRQHAQAV